MVNSVKKYSDLKTDLKFGLRGAYLFFGEEDYMKKHSLCEVRNAVLGEESDGAADPCGQTGHQGQQKRI